MPRYVDADALAKEIADFKKYFKSENSDYLTGYLCALSGIEGRIAEQSTVDAVPVVRCRECIHYDFGVCLKIYSDGGVSQYAWQERNEDDFCSYGKRKASDPND